MAKVPFTKLGLSKNSDVQLFTWNDQAIEVKQYLPVNDKLSLISNVLNNSADDNNFANPVKVDVFLMLEIVFNYTNINFTDKQKEDMVKLYDLFQGQGFFDKLLEMIPTTEITNLIDETWTCINAYYAYRNSVMGILENMKEDYNELDFDATTIQQKLANGENIEFLKEVLAKLG